MKEVTNGKWQGETEMDQHFSGIGQVEKFPHLPMLLQDVTPVRQMMRRIPIFANSCI